MGRVALIYLSVENGLFQQRKDLVNIWRCPLDFQGKLEPHETFSRWKKGKTRRNVSHLPSSDLELLGKYCNIDVILQLFFPGTVVKVNLALHLVNACTENVPFANTSLFVAFHTECKSNYGYLFTQVRISVQLHVWIHFVWFF